MNHSFVNDYAIGDLQGCYDGLRRLLDEFSFNPEQDRLWLVGDLINRGPQSLEVLRFLISLPVKPIITLGNHDLYFLAFFYNPTKIPNKNHTLDKLLKAPDCELLATWLRKQKLLYYSEDFNAVMVHAGIPPIWTLEEARQYAKEVEEVLSDDTRYLDFLLHIYGDLPDLWDDSLKGNDRLRTICNYFTRMRTCDLEGRLNIKFDKSIDEIPEGFYPWFSMPNRKNIDADILFGHWAALKGKVTNPNIYALDTGYIWGNELSALRLQDKKIFQVSY